MSSVSIKGVLIGAAVDLGLTFLAGFAMVIAIVAQQGVDSLEALDDIVMPNSLVVAGYAVAAVTSAIAGYVAARIAGKGELLNGALSSFLSVAIVLVSLIADRSQAFGAGDAYDLVSAPLFGLIGGFLRARQVRGRG